MHAGKVWNVTKEGSDLWSHAFSIFLARRFDLEVISIDLKEFLHSIMRV